MGIYLEWVWNYYMTWQHIRDSVKMPRGSTFHPRRKTSPFRKSIAALLMECHPTIASQKSSSPENGPPKLENGDLTYGKHTCMKHSCTSHLHR